MKLFVVFILILTFSSARSDLKSLQEILHGKPTCSACLTNYDVGNITETLLEHIHCESPTCGCLSNSEIYRITGSNQNTGICADNFHKFVMYLFHFVHKVNSTCDTSLVYASYVAMANSLFNDGETVEHVVKEILEAVMKNYEAEEESHEEHEEGHEDSHEGHGHEEEESHEEHEEGHEDSHEGHGHEEEESHEEGHEDSHEGHGHEEDNHEEQVVKCFTVDQILDSTGVDHEATTMTTQQQDTMATQIVIYLLRGFRYTSKCVALPSKDKFTNSLFSQFGVAAGGNMKKQDFSKLLSRMKIGGGSSSSHMEEEEEEGHEGHDHSEHARRKRQAPTIAINTCYSADALLAVHDVQDEITPDKFGQMCPALVQQQLSDACATKSNPMKSTLSDAEKYGFGFLSVIIISLASLVGLLMVPCTGKSAKNDILALFIGLAVGSLIGDAVLHLIPLALGVHGHSGADEHAHAHEGVTIEPHVQTGLAILAAIYAFFALESIMDAFASGQRNNVGNGSPAGSQHFNEKDGMCGIRSVGWMIIIGDGIHNFADGLAIGAAFSTSLKDGLATSIAVLCHELPHEFGDFAVLISSGMSYKMAALVNLLSALTAVVGMFIGAAIVTSPEVSKWIFTVVAGMFIYIALADMVPELIRTQKTATSTGQWIKRYLLETIGFFLGVLALTLIALFEEKIRF